MTLVIGIDPSLTATGVATPDGVRTIRSSGHDNDTLRQRSTRLHDLAVEVLGVIDGARSRWIGGLGDNVLVVIEAPAYASKTGKNHERSGLWWLIVDDLIGPGIAVDVVEVTTNQRMRYATGKGQADKDEVLAAVIRRYPDVDVRNNNEADALILRAMGCDAIGAPLVVVPKAHRVDLPKVAWPDYVHLEKP